LLQREAAAATHEAVLAVALWRGISKAGGGSSRSQHYAILCQACTEALSSVLALTEMYAAATDAVVVSEALAFLRDCAEELLPYMTQVIHCILLAVAGINK
jgi:hypothetical protein